MSRPRLLWRDWKRLARRLRRDSGSRGLVLFSDFDGTLAPIVRHPDRARLPLRTRRALERLAGVGGVSVGVVSGRSLADLRRRVGLPGIRYIGSHGEEWAGANGQRRRRANAPSVTRIRMLGRKLEKELTPLRGVFVERKAVSVAIHYRNATPSVAAQAQRAVRAAVRQESNRLRLLTGKKVLEILPPGTTSKGSAVVAALHAARQNGLGRPRLIYLGDDVTDETVFRRLRWGDLGIHVGTGADSRAQYRLGSPAGVARWLERLREALR